MAVAQMRLLLPVPLLLLRLALLLLLLLRLPALLRARISRQQQQKWANRCRTSVSRQAQASGGRMGVRQILQSRGGADQTVVELNWQGLADRAGFYLPGCF